MISALRENTQMDWVFTSKEKAMEGVKSGQYYAAIVVPEKFSTQMMSLFSDQIQKPEIIYYSNAKENAIAPKVTDKGATAIQKQVNQVFIQTISDTAMTVFQSVSNMAEANGADRLVDNLIHNLGDASDDMDMTASTLETFSGITSSAQSLLNASSDFLKELKTESADGKQVLENSQKTFTDMKTTISSATESVGKALKAGQKVYSEMSLLLDALLLPDHILDHDVINFSNRIAVFQNFPRLIRVEMNLDQILISSRNQTVSLKIFRDVICDLILVKIPVSSVDQ